MGLQSAPVIHQSKEPVSIEEAREVLVLPYPTDATNVQFAQYRDRQAVIELVRFRAPLEDCVAFAQAVVQNQGGRGLKEISNGTDAARVLLPVPITDPVSAPWFSPQDIRKGFIAGEVGSHMARVWIDAENEEVYYNYTD